MRGCHCEGDSNFELSPKQSRDSRAGLLRPLAERRARNDGSGKMRGCHCEELGALCAPSDEAIQIFPRWIASPARNDGGGKRRGCHCGELGAPCAPSDEAIQRFPRWIASPARNDSETSLLLRDTMMRQHSWHCQLLLAQRQVNQCFLNDRVSLI
jgi:hypothetical protein